MPSWEIKLHAKRSELVIYTQPSSFFLYIAHSHLKKTKKHVTFIGEQHLVCSPCLPPSSLAPSTSAGMYSPLNSKSILHFQNFSYVT